MATAQGYAQDMPANARSESISDLIEQVCQQARQLEVSTERCSDTLSGSLPETPESGDKQIIAVSVEGRLRDIRSTLTRAVTHSFRAERALGINNPPQPGNASGRIG